MKHRWTALIAVLALCALVGREISGQRTNTAPPGNQRIAGSLGQNFPNPFNPETRIPFTIGLEGNPPVCKNPEQRHRVTLRIWDILGRPVSVPILQGGGEWAGAPVERLLLSCGSYTAYWDGTIRGTDRKVSSGTHIYVLEVDGIATSKKMLVLK